MSDTNGKVKIYRNPEREKAPTYKPYVPQYQIEGIEPREYQSGTVPGNPKNVTRQPTPPKPVRQSYADPNTAYPVGRGKGPIPNVGNNVEISWSSVDGEIVDDLDQPIDPNKEMIDNNDFVTDQALGFQNGLKASDIQPHMKQNPAIMLEKEVVATKQPVDSNDLMSILMDLEEDCYLLIVSGVAVCSAPKEELEDQARALVFGEHEICDGNPIPIDDIVIIKRAKVKVGLFLE